MKGPFDGVLVIDLTHVLNGPFGTQNLCDLGARVIKIEKPGHGDDTRTYGPYIDGKSLYYSFINRGKESIVLDLKNNDDRELFFNMVKKADVLTENFKPTTMKKLGLSYETLAKINPRLIYASSSGFGHTGPMSQSAAYDTIAQAMSGIMLETGSPNDPPIRVGTSISDLCAGIYMFSAIASALYAREKTGLGTFIDIAMFDSTLAFLEHGFMAYVATGKAPERIGSRHPYMAPFDIYRTKDKHISICCGNDDIFVKLCHALGLADLLEDERFKTNNDRVANQAVLKAMMEEKLQEKKQDDWLNILLNVDIPVAPILDIAQALNLPQVAARNMLINAGGVKMPGNPIKMSAYPDPTIRDGAPELNQHGDQLRQEFKSKA
ncbi:CoA:oxalate CoA-transferase [Providencia sp. Me31A]|uniref:CoA:oxalate CoA-transferase n=1 Tax=Providencia sp. Me31A TaxID=3392637 RepID=UPI003D2A834B